jgi:hypothetical protein
MDALATGFALARSGVDDTRGSRRSGDRGNIERSRLASLSLALEWMTPEGAAAAATAETLSARDSLHFRPLWPASPRVKVWMKARRAEGSQY